MNWENEVSGLKTGSDMPEFLKLEAGTHKVTFLDEGTARESTFIRDGKEKIVPQINFLVKYKDKEYSWTVTKGETINSLYGQIALLGRKMGQLSPLEVTVIVKGSGKNKDYTIVEAAELAHKELESRKPVEVEKVD